jgi:SHS2 domain-containing protein
MVKSYKYLEDIATADIAFEAKGDSLNEVFEACADVVFDSMVEVRSVDDKRSFEFEVKGDDLEKLLYNFLEEIVYLKDSEAVIFKKCKVNVFEVDGGFGASAVLGGEEIDIKKHKLKVDVKAVTLHKFSLKKEGNGYVARIILDV